MSKYKDQIDKIIESPKNKFFVDTLLELGIPFSKLQLQVQRDGMPSGMSYMQPHDGNIRFFVPTIDGEVETYVTSNKNAKVHDWYLTRFATPKKTKTGDLAKYMPVQGGGTRLMPTPNVVQSYKSGSTIDVLVLIEGFKKGLAVWAHSNHYVIGMNGLTGFKEPAKERIRAELADLLKRCNVKKVIYCCDSDLFDLSAKKGKPETMRPNNFFRSALQAKTLIEPFCDVVLCYPTPGEKKLGFDDLLLQEREKEFTEEDVYLDAVKKDKGHERVFRAFNSALSGDPNDMFKCHKLTSLTDYKIKEIFHLDDVMSFYQYYGDTLKQRKRFKFFRQTYVVQFDGTIKEDKGDSTYGFIFKDNTIKKLDSKGIDYIEVANFTMRILFHITGQDSVRVAELTNYEGTKGIIEVTPEHFNNVALFNARVMGQGDFIFKGDKKDLLNLASILFKVERPAHAFEHLGYQRHGDFYAFANGLVSAEGWRACDEYGIVELNDENYYFPAFSKYNARNDSLYSEQRKFSHIETEKRYSFEEWKRQFSKVYGDNGEIACCYYIASLYSDIVFQHRSGIGYPILWSAGKPKTGKSTICTSMLALFGNGISSDSLTGTSTLKYKAARLAQASNSLVHFDEYPLNEKKVQEFLKNVFDRFPYGMKAYSNDSKTQVIPIRSALIVSGEVLPTDNHALFTRSLLMVFNRTADQRTDLERLDFTKLGRMEENGLTSVTVQLLQYRHHIQNDFDRMYSMTLADINKDQKNKLIDGRMKTSAAWILACVRVLMEKGLINYGMTFNELLDIWIQNLRMQDSQIKLNTDSAKFWDILDGLSQSMVISEASGDYLLDGSYLYIRLNSVHAKYMKEAYAQRLTKVLDKAALKNYLSNEPYFLDFTDSKGKPKKKRFKDSKNPVPALLFDYDKLRDQFDIDFRHDSGDFGMP